MKKDNHKYAISKEYTQLLMSYNIWTSKTPNLNGKIGDRMAPVHGKPGRWKVIIDGKKYSIHEKNLKDTSTLFRIQVFLSNMFFRNKRL